MVSLVHTVLSRVNEAPPASWRRICQNQSPHQRERQIKPEAAGCSVGDFPTRPNQIWFERKCSESRSAKQNQHKTNVPTYELGGQFIQAQWGEVQVAGGPQPGQLLLAVLGLLHGLGLPAADVGPAI